ncbi:methyltransferase [Nocardia sp. NBC_01499]|uniref:methyltransferase n=1 Tax=Nocardia sp. NBC_01499 TaxID=2903597 RepID=UPI0038644F11
MHNPGNDDKVYTGDADYDPVFGQMMLSMTLAPAVHAAAKLRVADVIDDKPVHIRDLAAKLGVHERSLDRLLRALAAFGVFHTDGDDRYGHSRTSRVLRANEPNTMLYLLLMSASEWNIRSWQGLADTVRTGKPAFRRIYGKDIFDYFATDDPESGERFHKAMSVLNGTTIDAIAEELELPGAKRVADIGGGQGTLLSAVLRRNPSLHGILFDLEQAMADLDASLSGEFADRCTVVAGDARRHVPVSADVYILKHVLHMWGDDTAIEVLRNIAAVAHRGARVIVAEQTISDDPSAAYTLLMDLQMLATMYGGERTEEQFAELFDQAGLQYRGKTPTRSAVVLLEGVVPL